MMMEWIKVSERLPDEYEKVLTFNPNRRDTKIELIKWFIGDEYEGITHWSPLPEPPDDN